MATAPQRGMNARTALEAATAYYENRTPNGAGTAQADDVITLASRYANWLDSRTKEKA
jgi:hypothetical protein